MNDKNHIAKEVVLDAAERITEKGGIDKARKYLRLYAETLSSEASPTRWERERRHFYWAVGFYGWGSAEEDLYFSNAETREEAIEEAMDNFARGYWSTSTFDDAGRVLVYELVEDSSWTKTGWEKDE